MALVVFIYLLSFVTTCTCPTPDKQVNAYLLHTLFVLLIASLISFLYSSWMRRELTNSMNKPSGPSLWRRLIALKKKHTHLLLFRFPSHLPYLPFPLSLLSLSLSLLSLPLPPPPPLPSLCCLSTMLSLLCCLQFQVKLASTSPAYKGPVAALTDQPFTNIDDALDRLQVLLLLLHVPVANVPHIQYLHHVLVGYR